MYHTRCDQRLRDQLALSLVLGWRPVQREIVSERCRERTTSRTVEDQVHPVDLAVEVHRQQSRDKRSIRCLHERYTRWR